MSLGDSFGGMDGLNYIGLHKQDNSGTKYNFMGLRKCESGGDEDLGNVDILQQDNNIFVSQHSHTQKSDKNVDDVLLDTQLLGFSL